MSDLFAPVKPEELEGLNDSSENSVFSPLTAEERAFADSLSDKGSNFEDFARGATQGFTANLSDELAGKIAQFTPSLRPEAKAIDEGIDETIDLQKQSKRAASARLGNLDQLIKEMQAQGASKRDIVEQVMFLKNQAGQEIGDAGDMTYDLYRDRERRLNAASKERSPWLYGGGEVIGAVGAGGAGAKLAAGGGKALAGVLAAEGGLAGLGASEGETVGEVALDAVKGAGSGLAGGAIGAGLGRGVKALAETQPVRALAKGGAKVFADLPTEFSEKLISNPNLKEPKSFDVIKDALLDRANKVRGNVKSLDDEAWSKLSDEAIATPDELKSIVTKNLVKHRILKKDALDQMPSLAKEKQAFSKAGEVLSELNQYGDSISERQLRDLLQRVRKESNFDTQEYQVSNEVLKSIGHDLDSLLKGKNAAYREAMLPVAKETRNLKSLQRNFKLQRDGDSLVDTDTTLSKLKSLSDDLGKKQQLKPNMQKSLERVGPDILEDLDTNRVFRTLEADTTRGSRLTTPFTILGSIAGTAVTGGNPVGGVVGGSIGYGVGRATDKFSRAVAGWGLRKGAGVIQKTDEGVNKIASSIVNGWSRIPEPIQKTLESAAQRGPRALGVSHFIYSQQSPEYRRATQGGDAEQEER